MTTDEIDRWLGNTGVQLPPAPQPSQRHLERMQQLRREHEAKLKATKEKTDERIRDRQQHRDELIAEHQLHKRLLREQSMFEQSEQDRAELEGRQGYRHFLEQLGSTLGDREKQQLEDELSGVADETDSPELQKLSSWLESVWRQEAIDVRPCRDARIMNGAASRAGRYINISLPIRNLRLATIVGHELGHLLHPTIENERVVDGEFGKKIYPQSEVAAWTWMITRTPIWSSEMHAFMKRCLDSYRPYADETEAKAMDAICSQLTFLETQLRIAQG